MGTDKYLTFIESLRLSIYIKKKMADKIRWAGDPATIEALGETKVRNLGSFIARNATPASLAQRFSHWALRVNTTMVSVPKVGMRPFFLAMFLVTVQQYATRYSLTPLMEKHKWRKY